MRVAALYDIHGNLPALEAVLADPRLAEVDLVVCGGDLVAGPLPSACFDLTRGARRAGACSSAGTAIGPRSSGSAKHGASWCADELGPERLAVVAGWPLTVDLDVAGGTTFCHATPRSDDEIVTSLTPDDELAEALADARQTLVDAGHTHMQVDRRLQNGRRFVVAGSVGRPYEGVAGAFWALIGDDVELVRTDYDVSRRGRRDRAVGVSRCRGSRGASCSSRRPRTRSLRTSRASVARSYVREARRRGLGSRRERIGPIIERLAEEHADAEIALRFGSDVELLISVMLSAQTTDVNVNRVTERLFVKYRKPEDYLAVPQEELEQDIFQTGFYRQKAKAIRGSMRVLLEEFDGQVPRRIPELLRLPGVARKTANVVAAELGDAQGIVVDTHVRRLSQRLGLTKRGGPGQDRARPRQDRAAPGLAPLPAPPHLARPACLRRAAAAVRGLRARRPLPVEPAARLSVAFGRLRKGRSEASREVLRRQRSVARSDERVGRPFTFFGPFRPGAVAASRAASHHGRRVSNSRV